MQNIPMVDLQGQYAKIKTEVDAAIAEVISSASFINGPAVKSFAASLAAYQDCKYVIPCANGTDALQIALMALDLQPGDEVITTPFTFVATVEVIALLRLKPVFVDIDAETFNIDPNRLEEAITNKTKAIIPVHLFGQCADMEPIMQIADKHGIPVIEDNAQAIGADYTFSDGKKIKSGSIGLIGTTSFFPSKNLGAYGDGGAIFTNDDHIGGRMKMITNHGSTVRYYHDDVGVNSRLDSIQAAVLDIKLKHLDAYCATRRSAADYYSEHLSQVDGITPPIIAHNSDHVFHQYTMKVVSGRDQLADALKAKGIPTGVYYPKPLHVQKAYSYYGFKAGDFPTTEQACLEVLSLPMHTELTRDTQDYIIDAIKTTTS